MTSNRNGSPCSTTRSFLDDPTRLLRLARYAARLGFSVAPHTRELATEAISNGALDTVSGTRIGNELRLLANETRSHRRIPGRL